MREKKAPRFLPLTLKCVATSLIVGYLGAIVMMFGIVGLLSLRP